MPYPRIYPPEEQGYHPTAASRTLFVDTVDEQVARTIVAYLAASTAPLRVARLRVLGGAMARVPAQATAFAHRTSRHMVNLTVVHGRPRTPRPTRPGSTAWPRRSATGTRAPLSTSWATRARRGSARPTRVDLAAADPDDQNDPPWGRSRR